MAKIMLQGTASSVGKSILTAALCRIFKQEGYTVCPFKAQNMSLNSYITLDGKEMGRAQVFQAYAAGLEPEAYMNPILLKPTTDKKCQVIVNGKVYCNSSAMEYHNMKLMFADMLKSQFKELEEKFDVVVIEGAGSPAEINLRDRDIVNMGMAEIAEAPVLLVGDIDKGGVFAALAGTIMLLREDEKKRVKGTIINKFRGDLNILKPGLTMIEDIIKIPTLGVVPYFKLQLEDEDGAVSFNKRVTASIDVAVIKLPHISNFTDFDALRTEEDVSVRFIESDKEFGEPDLVIIPGTKNTMEDLLFLRESGMEAKIKAYSNKGMLIGICGGYQMLGDTVKDPFGVETELKEIEGMKLLSIDTVFEKEKATTRVKGKCNILSQDINIYGYEIHMGICSYKAHSRPLFIIHEKDDRSTEHYDGAVNESGNILGTYVHGVFDGESFREYILSKIRENKGLPKRESKPYESLREQEIDKLADIVRENLNMDRIYEIAGLRRAK